MLALVSPDCGLDPFSLSFKSTAEVGLELCSLVFAAEADPKPLASISADRGLDSCLLTSLAEDGLDSVVISFADNGVDPFAVDVADCGLDPSLLGSPAEDGLDPVVLSFAEDGLNSVLF